jgi:hypothetical protein
MVSGEKLASAQLVPVTPAVLAGVVVAGEEEGVGDLPPEAVGDVHVADQTNHCGSGDDPTLGPEDVARVLLQDLGLSVDHQPHRPLRRDDRQRLERRVQC